MSSRSRMMGAGNASSSVYSTNVNMNTFGGSKKQGITSRVGLDNWANVAVQTYSNGYGKDKLVCMNQLGGVGAGKSMFNGRFTQADGVHCESKSIPIPPTPTPPFTYNAINNTDFFLLYTDPYVQLHDFNISIVVNSAPIQPPLIPGTSATFEVLSYETLSYTSTNFIATLITLESNNTYTFTVPGSLVRFLSLQFKVNRPGDFNIQSFKVNGIEQLSVIPFISPPPPPP